MQKKFLLFLLIKNIYSKSTWKGFEEKIENTAHKVEKTIKNGISKVNNEIHYIEKKIEEKHFEANIITDINGNRYVPLDSEIILYDLKKNNQKSIFLTNPQLLINTLTLLKKFEGFLPFPNFEVASRKENEEFFANVQKCINTNINKYYYGSIFFSILFLLTVIYSTKENWNNNQNFIHNNSYLIITNFLCILLLFIMFPKSHLVNLYRNKILLYFAILLLILPFIYNIYKNYQQYEKTESYEILTLNHTLKVRNASLIFLNLIFILTTSLYFYSLRINYNKLQKKINHVGLMNKGQNIYYIKSENIRNLEKMEHYIYI
jgi:hypothetical protein